MPVKTDKLDEDSEIDTEKDVKRRGTGLVDTSNQIAAKTPDSIDNNGEQTTGNQMPAETIKPNVKTEINKILSNNVIGELDVETNYLRSSANNLGVGDELNLKTVFQKRGPRPSE